MAYNKYVNPEPRYRIRYVRGSDDYRVWYCCRCGFGSLNLEFDTGCADCGMQRCERCRLERVSGMECVTSREELAPTNISPRTHEALRHAALPLTTRHDTSHVSSSSDSGAATPLSNIESMMSDGRLANSSVSAPYPHHLPHIIGPNTGSSFGVSNQSRTSAQQQQRDEIRSGQWNAGGHENSHLGLPFDDPIYEPFYQSPSAEATSQDDARSNLPYGSAQRLGFLAKPITPDTSDSEVNYSIQHTEPAANFTIEGWQSTQGGQWESITGADPNRGAVDDITPDASAFMPAALGYQTNIFPAGSGGIQPEWLGFTEPSAQLHVNLQFPSSLGGVTSPTWPPDNNDCANFPQPQRQPIVPLIPRGTASPHQPKTAQKSRARCCDRGKTRPFACFFYKYNPKLHQECMTKSFKKIGHLRQHLKLNHKLRPDHCSSCWRDFATADELAGHIDAGPCVPTGGVPVRDMNKFPRTRIPRENKWYWGWRQLFGEAAAPPSCPFHHGVDDLTAWIYAQGAGATAHAGARFSGCAPDPDPNPVDDENLVDAIENLEGRPLEGEPSALRDLLSLSTEQSWDSNIDHWRAGLPRAHQVLAAEEAENT